MYIHVHVDTCTCSNAVHVQLYMYMQVHVHVVQCTVYTSIVQFSYSKQRLLFISND